MKGPYGIVIAALLGVAAMVVNWVYISNKTKGGESIVFLGLKNDVQAGDSFQENDFDDIAIPKNSAGDLEKFVYLYDDKNLVKNIPATRDYKSGELLFREAYRTPPETVDLKDDEEVIWIPVDTRSFVPSLAKPGDLVTFIVPTRDPNAPTPAVVESETDDTSDAVSFLEEPFELVGPFVVKTIGARLGSTKVYKSRRLSPTQENIIGILVKKQAVLVQKDGELVKKEGAKFDTETTKLLKGLQAGNYRNVGVSWKPQ